MTTIPMSIVDSGNITLPEEENQLEYPLEKCMPMGADSLLPEWLIFEVPNYADSVDECCTHHENDFFGIPYNEPLGWPADSRNQAVQQHPTVGNDNPKMSLLSETTMNFNTDPHACPRQIRRVSYHSDMPSLGVMTTLPSAENLKGYPFQEIEDNSDAIKRCLRFSYSGTELQMCKTQRDRGALKNRYDRLNELASFKAQHGHCNVPQKYKANQKLGTW